MPNYGTNVSNYCWISDTRCERITNLAAANLDLVIFIWYKMILDKNNLTKDQQKII
jgi:hypothetical protein